ncbi:MAG: ATP synthase F0 subunit B [Thermodesulfobacteriota bacterium]
MNFSKIKNLILALSLLAVLTTTSYAASGDLLSVNYTVFIQIIIFLAAIFILNKLVFKPFISLVDRRDKLTRGAIEEAHELEEKVKAIMEDYDAKLSEARSLAIEERNKLIAEGQNVAQEILGEARNETGALLDEAKVKLEAETKEIKEKIKSDIDSLAGEIATKVLGKEVGS